MKDLKISKKKPSFPISGKLNTYLTEYNRNLRIPIFYDDLLRFQGSVVVYDKHDNDTLWTRVYYNEFERENIDLSLKKVYTTLHSDGNSVGAPGISGGDLWISSNVVSNALALHRAGAGAVVAGQCTVRGLVSQRQA